MLFFKKETIFTFFQYVHRQNMSKWFPLFYYYKSNESLLLSYFLHFPEKDTKILRILLSIYILVNILMYFLSFLFNFKTSLHSYCDYPAFSAYDTLFPVYSDFKTIF